MFKTLAKQFHPDVAGTDTTAIMQAINAEYVLAIARAAKGEDLSSEEVEAEILNAEQYKNAINAIIHLESISIEVCGGWIWVNGNTYPYRQIFKAAGFYFASVKKAWYFRSVEYKTDNKKSKSMEEIRRKYGSQTISGGASSWNKYLSK